MTTPQPSPSTTPSARHTSFTFKAVVLAIPLIVSLAIFGVIFRARAREIAQIEKQLDYEKERGAKLEVVAYRYSEYIRLLRDLETRVNTIKALQDTRTGPVELMRGVEKLAMQTTDVDLYSFAPEDQRLVFRGRSPSMEAAARFLASLKGNKSFSDARLREFYRDSGKNSATYRVEFDCTFVPPPH